MHSENDSVLEHYQYVEIKKKRKEVPICNISYSDKVVIRFIMNSKSLSIVPITLFIYILHLYNSKYFL